MLASAEVSDGVNPPEACWRTARANRPTTMRNRAAISASRDGPAAGVETTSRRTATSSRSNLRTFPAGCDDDPVHISAKTDYAMRAMLVLAHAARERADAWVKAEEIADEQRLPRKFLEAILADLRRARLVESLRGAEGGYRLAKPASAIYVADVMRAVDGPLAEVRGLRPENVRYEGAAAGLQDVWVAVRAGLRAVLERVSVEDVANRTLPKPVQDLVAELQGWIPRY